MSANLLADEKSPYLLQHRDNPVAWRPWGQAAFDEARRLNKPVFLSIGYSTCHWCHVMAHESFENTGIAELMNEHFINIKVDREERPDVDRLYMAFVQATTGSGGWPMSVWLTPEAKPFFGGTYFPPEDRYGRAGFPNILRQIARLWTEDAPRIEREGERVMSALREIGHGSSAEAGELNALPLAEAYEQLASAFDGEWGGFGGAPKFPRPSTFNFLLRYATRSDAVDGDHALRMTLFTLQRMAAGGMYDQVGHGFHRYSVDGFWHVPHFEKMLYDQAQLVVSYVEAWQITKDELWLDVASRTLDYVLREMTHPEGGFFSAEDADSLLEHGSPEHAEGAFYVWRKQEIVELLGAEDAELFSRIYGVEDDGNAPEGSDPQGEFRGQNILIQRMTIPKEDEARLEACRAKLFAHRARRPRPHLDDKILTAWNGLMIGAFAKAGAAFDEPRYVEGARRAAAFLEDNLTFEGDLLRSWREGPSLIAGFAEDYAFLIQGLLDLYEATFENKWFAWAQKLQHRQDALFWDAEGGSYYNSAGHDPLVTVRMKEDYDGAEPSANSISALNLLRQGRMLHDDALEQQGRRILAAHEQQMARVPTGVPQMLVALDLALTPPAQAVVAGDDAAKWIAPLHRDFQPRRVLLRVGDSSAAEGMRQPGLYLCENFTCQAPITDSADY